MRFLPCHLTLQMALGCASLDEVATLRASSLDMPALALLQGALAETTSGDYGIGDRLCG